jgi:UDP-2-acetamido-2-deoxy-ribo-hexuluronate aminotransferase
MDKIHMVDLYGQYKKIKEEVDKEIFNVIESSQFINGKVVKEFQGELEKYLSVKHVVPCANGTDALQIALMTLDLKPGDEVITSNFTFIATAEVIALLGLKPVLVDVDPKTFLINPQEIKKRITSKTKVILPVHLFGQSAEMEMIETIAKESKLFIIEDNAQAIGANYFYKNGTKKKLGTIGDIGCTSFFPSKNLGCFGDGGAIFTNNDLLAEKIRSISNHGMKVRYYHENIGVNSRLDSIQAAVLKIKLKYLDHYNNKRIETANFYDNAFDNHPNIEIPDRTSNSNHVFHQYTLKTKNIDRNKLQELLAEKGIPSMIYYPVPIHLQKAFKELGYKEGDFPVSELLCKSVLSLPIHTELDKEQLDYIVGNVINISNSL